MPLEVVAQFTYRKGWSELLGLISLPYAELYAERKDGSWMRLGGLVDSGAVISILHYDYARELGIERVEETDVKGYIYGVCRGRREVTRILVYVHKIRLRIGEEIFEVRVGFAESGVEVPTIIGRLDIFDKYIVQFDDAKRIISFMKDFSKISKPLSEPRS